MKSAVLVALAAPLALAQGTTSYSTETYTSCSTGPGVTVTSTGTKTLTEPCTMAECTASPSIPGGNRSGTIHTTVYTTVYTMLCPTGSEERTVTVTESCSSATPVWSMSSSGYVPPSWTTGMVSCMSCGPAPTSAMLTYPAYAVSNGTPCPTAAYTAPAATGAPSSVIYSANVVSSTVTVAPVGSGSAAPAAAAPTTEAECVDCKASGTTSPMATYTGAASNNKAAWCGLSSVLLVAGGAFLL